MADPRVALSKRLAVALRHRPEAFGLTLDAAGWVPLAVAAAALRVPPEALLDVVAMPGKRRYEVDGERIRARYGHSVAEPVALPVAVPPATLWHGTSAAAAGAILAGGLRPMRRQYVHLSADRATALAVARRRRGEVALLTVAARAAHGAGVAFRDAGDGVWLADPVPAAFVALAG